MRALGDVAVIEERYVRDCDVWTSAGVSAGMDLMLAFIANVAGDVAAGKVQFAAEYYPSAVRYGGFDTHAQAPGCTCGKVTRTSTPTNRSSTADEQNRTREIQRCRVGASQSPLPTQCGASGTTHGNANSRPTTARAYR